MDVDISVLILGGVNVATLAFGYGVLWTQVGALKKLVERLEILIDATIMVKLNDHESRIRLIEDKHDRCDV